jgi:hypothetical protein
MRFDMSSQMLLTMKMRGGDSLLRVVDSVFEWGLVIEDLDVDGNWMALSDNASTTIR